MTSITTKLGKRIKELRKQSNLTQDYLAEKAGLSGKHIGEIERGEVNVTAQSLEKIATALEIELPELMRCDHEGDVENLREKLIRHIQNCPAEEVAKIMTELISDFDFFEELRLRFKSRIAAGITTRLLFSLIHHNFKEPSINKAKFLYEASFQEQKKEKKDNNQKPPKIVSESNCHKCLKYHRNVLHYCAAYIIVRPRKALTEDAFINDVKKFFSIAEGFKTICLGHDPSRRNEYAPPFIFEENFLHFKPHFETPPATSDEMEPYPLKRMEDYMDKHSRFTQHKPDK